jgi:NADPH-dependent ferric siderophore reductase
MPQGFEAGRVSAERLLSPRIRNITIAAESLAGFVLEPGADVAIRLPGGDGGADERHYSVWKSTAEGTVDLCVVLHGLGPGSRWAAGCAVGGTCRDLALPRSPDRTRPLGKNASILGRRDLDRVG